MKRKTKSIILIVALSLAMLLLATGVAAAMTNGFKNVNPYGWLENFDRIKKDSDINGFEVCKDFELDFAKLIKGVKATEDKEAGTKTYALVKTDNESVYINVVETIADEKSSYALIVNGQSVCTSADGFNDTAIEAIKSFDTCKVSEVHNAGRLAHYIGATYTKPAEDAGAKKKYELMSVGQTISGFEFDLTDFDCQELIKGIEPVSHDGCTFYKIVILDDEHQNTQIGIYKAEEGAIKEGSPELYYLIMNEVIVWSSDTSLLPVATDFSSVESFTAVKIKEVCNAEVLAKYVGAKA